MSEMSPRDSLSTKFLQNLCQETLEGHESRRAHTAALVKIATHGDPHDLYGHLVIFASSPEYNCATPMVLFN